MDGTLRNMASIYISRGDKMLLLYRQGGRVVNDVWVGSAGGHFEEYELNDVRACVLREIQEELISSNEGVSRWFPLSELTSLEMPFTSKYVIEHYLNVGCKTDMIYGGIADGEKVVFTEMPEF